MSIYEILLRRPQAPVSNNVPDFTRLEELYQCLQTVKKYFDHFMVLSNQALRSISMMVPVQLSQGLVILYHLTVLDDPIWDRSAVRKTLDILDLMERIAVKFERVPVDLDVVNDMPDGFMFTRAAKITRSLKICWAKEINEILKNDTSSSRSGSGSGSGSYETAPSSIESVNLDGMNLDDVDNILNNSWFSDYLAPYDYPGSGLPPPGNYPYEPGNQF